MKNIFDKWRLFKEVLAPDSEESEYEKAISSAETAAGLDPEAQKTAAAEKPKQKTSTSGTIKSSCNCVDSSESGLSVKEIKKLINKYYTEKNPDPSFKKLNVDNDCNLETQKAIMQFQADTGAEQDGCVGDETEGKMVEAGLIDKPTIPQSYSAAGTAAAAPAGSTNSAPISAAVGSATGGVTIAIKASTTGSKPHRIVGPNYHGYGVDSHDTSRKTGKAQTPNTANDAYIINPVWFGDVITSSHIGMRKILKRKQYGHPALAKIISSAADSTGEIKPARDGGVALVSGVSLGGPDFPCYNQKDIDKNPNTPCVQGGWGVGTKAIKYHKNQTGGHRFGHQSGLEADISYYRNSGLGSKYWKVPGRWKEFDYERNLAFAEALLGNNQIELVLIGKDMVRPLIRWVEKNNRQEQFPKAYASLKSRNSGALKGDSTGGHNDHFHVRMKFPDNSFQNMKQFKLSVSKNNATKQEVGKTSNLMAKLPEDKSKYSFILGTVDGNIIASHNPNKEIYGASIQKPIAALVQMVQYKQDKNKKLNDKELGMLLSYNKTFRGSNEVNRAISRNFRGNRPFYKERTLGKIDPRIMRQVLGIFGIKNTKFVYSNNKQSSLDYYKFLSGLARMKNKKFKNNQEKEFAALYGEEIDKIFKFTTYIPSNIKKRFNDIGINNFWAKGGRANGALNYGIIIDDKHVLVVYTRFGPGGKLGSAEHAATGRGGAHTNMMLSIVKNLFDKIK